MTLRESFGIKSGDVISLVGGGGKTTLMFALAHELASSKGCVITTTTTRIMHPSPRQTPLVLMDRDEEVLKSLLIRNMNKYKHITLATERFARGKLKGITPEFVAELAALNRITCIIVEADGSLQKSLKAPNSSEPVIPLNTSLVIPIIGIDVLGLLLTEENVFRSEIASNLLGIPSGSVLTVEAIALLLTHEHGIIKGSPRHARIIPLINKMDLDDGLSKGRDLAKKILARMHPQIEQIVLGQAKLPNPVLEVVKGNI